MARAEVRAMAQCGILMEVSTKAKSKMAQSMVVVSTGGLMGISTLVILSMTRLEDTERVNMLPAEIPTLVILNHG